MRRLSVTLVEAFRSFADEQRITEQELQDHIAGVFRATPAMEFGTAYHRLVERGVEREGCVAHVGQRGTPPQYLPVAPEVLDMVVQYRKTFPDLTMTGRKSAVFECGGETVEVIGVSDGMLGRVVHEHKTVAPGSTTDYRLSYQWRLYCELFAADAVQYNLFYLEARDASALAQAQTVDDYAALVTAVTLESFVVYRYAALQEDCRRMVGRLVTYLTTGTSTGPRSLQSENERILKRIRGRP